MACCAALPADAETLQLLSPAESVIEPSGKIEEIEPEAVFPEEVPLAESKVETHVLANGYAGYRFVGIDSYGGRAAEYDYLHSNPTFGGQYNLLGKDHKFALEGSFLNDKDYIGDLIYDYKGNVRFEFRTESFFHNLDHEAQFSPVFELGTAPNQHRYTPYDLNAGDRYGLRTEQDLVRVRLKPSDHPFHINLGYWRMLKEGNKQLRFADHDFEPKNAGLIQDSIISKSSRVDRQVHEGTFSLDSHLGPLDMEYEFKIRQFEQGSPIQRDSFIARPTERTAGLQEHNAEPENRFYSHTVKLHTSLSGGIVGAASYTYARRANLANLADTRGVDQSRDTLQNMAGDFVYTPCSQFSLGVRYRRQEIERGTTATLTNDFYTNPVISVRPGLDSVKDVVSLTLSVRPTSRLTFKGEYKGEFVQRDETTDWNRADKAVSVAIPHSTALHKGTFSILSRPLNGMRLKALYSYATTGDPAYGNSFEEKHEAQMLATYTSKEKWGVTANYKLTREHNGQTTLTTLTISNPTPYTYQLPWDRRTVNANASFWFVPVDRMTVTGSYAFVRNNSDKAILFAGTTPGSNIASNFTSQAHVYSLNALYHLTELLDLSLLLQQVRSFSEFDPQFLSVNATNNTEQVKEISSTKTVETTVSARINYRLTTNLSCAFDYAFKEYHDRNATSFNGSVQTFIASLTRKW